MKLIKNSGNDRVIDELKQCLQPESSFDIASPDFSLFAFGELREQLSKLSHCRLVLPNDASDNLSLLGDGSDRSFRNRLQGRWLARQCAEWIEKNVEVRRVPIEQKTIAGKTVHNIGAGTLLVCLAEKISVKEIEPLAQGIVSWHKELAPAGETTVVFRDSAFDGDVAKTNLTAILNQHGIGNVRSL